MNTGVIHEEEQSGCVSIIKVEETPNRQSKYGPYQLVIQHEQGTTESRWRRWVDEGPRRTQYMPTASWIQKLAAVYAAVEAENQRYLKSGRFEEISILARRLEELCK